MKCDCTQLAIGASDGSVRVVETYKPFAGLVDMLVHCRR